MRIFFDFNKVQRSADLVRTNKSILDQAHSLDS
ncbi:hypothetical protein C8R11_1285 [Nitrosomonas aestuarii]|nr:hypothetical protein C8R11_1285 [Nitrosomonas aestuarii]